MKDQLSSNTVSQIKEKFGSNAKITYQKHYDTVTIKVDGDYYLTFDNFKFLSDLFKTTHIDTGVYIGRGGCPTCDGEYWKEITFTVSKAVVE